MAVELVFHWDSLQKESVHYLVEMPVLRAFHLDNLLHLQGIADLEVELVFQLVVGTEEEDFLDEVQVVSAADLGWEEGMELTACPLDNLPRVRVAFGLEELVELVFLQEVQEDQLVFRMDNHYHPMVSVALG